MAPVVKSDPVLKLNFLSHGTLECIDIEATRKFYEQFLGFEIVRTGKISMTCRLNSATVFVCIEVPKKGPMPLMNHIGLDVATPGEVDAAYAVVSERAEVWGVKKVTRPVDQHGTRSFYLLDQDENWWEILANPQGGYTWQFEKGGDFQYTDLKAEDNPNGFVGRGTKVPTNLG
jgi:catechol 2,3-dioxygenase-like lactoylglutathione lyase family enzyme